MQSKQIEFLSGAISPGDCVSEAWQDIKTDYWYFFAVSVVAWLIAMAAGSIPVVNILAAPFVAGPLFAGVYWMFIGKADGKKREFGEVFAGFRKFMPTFVIGLILSIPGIILQIYQLVTMIQQIAGIMTGGIGSEVMQQEAFPPVLIGIYLFLVIFGLTVGILLFFSLYLVMDHDLGAIEAIGLSSRAALANVGGLILLIILQALIAIAGVLACLIGILFVMPLLYLTSAIAYRQVFPRAEQPKEVHTPPSPDVYGDLQNDAA